MKEVKVYVAFDDEEFDTKAECEEYEKAAYDKLVELSECYSFYDENMNLFIAPVSEKSDVETMVEWVDDVYNGSEYVRMKQTPPEYVMRFLYNHLGYILPEEDCGLYRYNMNDDEWVRMAD